MEVSSGIEQLYFVTILVKGQGVTDDAPSKLVEWTGTAFLYGVTTNQGQANFVVSNRHVLLGDSKVTCNQLELTFVALDHTTGQPDYGHAVVAKIDNPTTSVTTHASSDIDVAVMPCQPVIELLKARGEEAFVKVVGPDLVLSKDQLIHQASALEDVIFVGYPSGIYDTTNHTPVARRGMTATPIMLDYRGQPMYLIDAAVFEGSSGSPVFLYGPPPQRPDGSIVLGEGRRLLFAGVLASVHARERLGTIIAIPTAWATVSKELLGLGIVFKPWTIDECIEPILQAHGLHRVSITASSTNVGTPADQALSSATDETSQQ